MTRSLARVAVPGLHKRRSVSYACGDGCVLRQAVPVSMTKERTGFHTYSSKKECVPDSFGLLCERESLSGGDSMVANAVGIRRRMAEESLELLEILEQDFARDIVTPNADKNSRR